MEISVIRHASHINGSSIGKRLIQSFLSIVPFADDERLVVSAFFKQGGESPI